MKKIDSNGVSNGASPSADLFVGNIIGAFSRALSDKMDRAVRDAAGLSNSACYAIVTIGSEPNSSIETLRRMLSLEHPARRSCLNCGECLQTIVAVFNPLTVSIGPRKRQIQLT